MVCCKILKILSPNQQKQAILVYAGIAKILKAYTYSVAVDVFGDVPYSEANKLKQGIVHPKFDDDASIYESLFALINEGIADLNNTYGSKYQSTRS